jgi:TrmH family RNA methyltransferase
MAAPLSRRREKEIAKLARRRYRQKHGQTLVEGPRALTSTVEAGAPLVEVIVTRDALDIPDVQMLTARAGVPVYVTDDETMHRLSDVQTHQGVLGVVERQLVEPSAIPDRLGNAGTVLVLDGVQDPGNVGTILRTAAWFGTDAVVAGPGTAGWYGPKVMRAAAGGHWDVVLARTDTPGRFLDLLRKAGCALYGADLYGVSAREWAPERPSALVLGSEAHGLSGAVLDRLDAPVAIPGAARRPGAESLNVAVASGILVYEWIG